MHFKRKIQKRVYGLYLSGVYIITIGSHLHLTTEEVNEIIDYLNEIYAL